MPAKVWSTVLWSLQSRGLRGTLQAAAASLRRALGKPAPPIPVHPLDLRLGTDTSGLIGGGQLAAGSPSDRHITAYAGISPSRFHAALARWQHATAGQPPAGYTFIDLGCGKGRALLLAAEYGFRHVLGLELNAGLAAIARRNVEIWRAAGRTLSPVEVLHADATDLQLPAGPCLLFLYNPFGPAITRTVLDTLERQKRHTPGELYLLYQNENPATPLRNDPRLQLIWTATLPLSDEDRQADPVSAPDDVTSLYRWLRPAR